MAPDPGRFGPPRWLHPRIGLRLGMPETPNASPSIPAPRSPAESATHMSELVLPQHANAVGTAFGGTIMSWIDICGAICAQRHAGRVAVTAFVDDIEFVAPIRVGDVVVLDARITAAFRSSMEVEVSVEREDTETRTRTRCVDARLTFVQLDAAGRPVPVPPLVLGSDAEKRDAAAAEERRRERLAQKAAKRRS